MKKLVLAAVVALSITAPARAEVLDLRISHIPPHWHIDRGPRIIVVQEPLSEASRNERAASVERWEKFCQPVGWTDAYGVTRLAYARPGCEFGRER